MVTTEMLVGHHGLSGMAGRLSGLEGGEEDGAPSVLGCARGRL